MFQINGLPVNYTDFDLLVVIRGDDGNLWFYDAWMEEDKEDANRQAREEGGFVFTVGH